MSSQEEAPSRQCPGRIQSRTDAATLGAFVLVARLTYARTPNGLAEADYGAKLTGNLSKL